MEIDNKNSEDYSWFKVHWKNIVNETKILISGVIKNFKRVTWHSKKGLALEYIQVVGVLIFLSLFCFAVYSLVGLVQVK